MATNNAINLSQAGLARYDGAGTFTGVTVTNHAVLIGASSNGITSLPLTNGQLAIGSTGADPVAATLTAGTGMSITNGAGSITLNALGGGLTWTVVTGTSQAGASNNGYIANNAGMVTVTLPATSAVGDILAVTGINNATGWRGSSKNSFMFVITDGQDNTDVVSQRNRALAKGIIIYGIGIGTGEVEATVVHNEVSSYETTLS